MQDLWGLFKFYKFPCNQFDGTWGTIDDRGMGQSEFRKVSLFWGNKLNLSWVGSLFFPHPLQMILNQTSDRAFYSKSILGKFCSYWNKVFHKTNASFTPLACWCNCSYLHEMFLIAVPAALFWPHLSQLISLQSSLKMSHSCCMSNSYLFLVNLCVLPASLLAGLQLFFPEHLSKSQEIEEGWTCPGSEECFSHCSQRAALVQCK